MARILLIEDDHDVRTMLRLTLAKFGHTVTEARDGKEGLRLLDAADPQLVITDLLMPEMEGLSVVMELRVTRPALKIIAISGGGRVGPDNYLRVAKHIGARKILVKPFPAAALLTAVEDLLSEAPQGPPSSRTRGGRGDAGEAVSPPARDRAVCESSRAGSRWPR
jgi:DNA-binding response OmpR family regulator